MEATYSFATLQTTPPESRAVLGGGLRPPLKAEKTATRNRQYVCAPPLSVNHSSATSDFFISPTRFFTDWILSTCPNEATSADEAAVEGVVEETTGVVVGAEEEAPREGRLKSQRKRIS